jgi:mannitol operon transcriptional antiterminator
MSLNNRCLHIIHFILSQDKPVKLDQLKEQYKVSERTIRYDLSEIGYWLKKQSLGELEVVYSQGVRVSCTPENKTAILRLFKDKLPKDYYYSSEERQKIILLELLNAEQPLKIDSFQKKLSISRGTIIKELKLLDGWLEKYNLSLIRKPNYGIELQGDELAKRNTLLGIVNDFMSTDQIIGMIRTQHTTSDNNDGSFSLGIQQGKIFKDIDLSLLEQSLHYLEDLLLTQLGDNSFASLFTHLAIALQRIKGGKGIFIPHEDLVILEKTNEFKMAELFSSILEKNFHITIPKSEVGYITLHILAAQLNQSPDSTDTSVILDEEKISKSIYNAKELLSSDFEINYLEMARDITGFVEKLLNIEFKDNHQLLMDLSIHLKPSIHRCKYNMCLTNPLLLDIKKRYYRVFVVVREALLLLKVKYPYEMNDHEISYIVLHFAAEIEKEKVKYYRRLNVLLVCASGIGTAKMLFNRLSSNFRDLNIINTVSYFDFLKKDIPNIDLVISTINIKTSPLPCLVVNPLLDEQDIVKIEEYLLLNAIKNGKKKVSISRKSTDHLLSEDLKYNNTIEYDKGLKTQKENDISIEEASDMQLAYDISLKSLLTEESIRLNVYCRSWEEAIELSSDILLQKNCIEPKYVTALIDLVKIHGPYTVIAPGIAFSHAKPKDGVLALGLSLIRLSEPISFGHKENDPVKLVFTLSPIDNISHHKALSQLMKIFLNKRELDILYNALSIDEVLECIAANSD